MHRARSKGVGRKHEHTARETALSRKKTNDQFKSKAAFMSEFYERKTNERKLENRGKDVALKAKKAMDLIPTVLGQEEKFVEFKHDLQKCLSEPGADDVVKRLKSKAGGVIGKMEYEGKQFAMEKRKKVMMARKAEIELVLEQRLERKLNEDEDGADDDDEDKLELPTFVGSMSKKKKKHNKKMLRRSYTK
jgi:hypothetical protein